jgi:hypothetical protein
MRYNRENEHKFEFWFGCPKCGYQPTPLFDMSKEGRWYVYRTGQCPKCKTELTKNKKVK